MHFNHNLTDDINGQVKKTKPVKKELLIQDYATGSDLNGLKTHVRTKNHNNNNNDDITNSLKDTLSADENLKLKVKRERKVVTKRASSAHGRKIPKDD